MAPQNHAWWGGWGKHHSPSVSAAELKALHQKIAQLERLGLQGKQAQSGAGAAGNAKSKAKWWCLCSNCEKSKNGALNNANRTTCFGCGKDKGYCLSPPAHLCRADAQENLAALKKEKEEAAKKVKEEAASGKPQPKAKAAAKPPKAESTPVTPLPDLPVAPSLEGYDKGRAAAPTTVEVKTAEECLLGAAPRDRALELAQARDDVAYFTTQLDGAKLGALGSARQARIPELQAELLKATTAAEKLAVNAPETACSLTLLQKSLSDYEHQTTTITAFWQRGAAKALAAEGEAVKAVQEHIKEWQAYLAALEADAKTRRAAWLANHEAARATMVQVAATLKERHTAAAAQSATLTGGVAVAPAPTPTPTPTISSCILPMVELPPAAAVDEEDLEKYAFTQRVLEHHSVQDVDFPMTFANIPLDRKSIAVIVGSQIWTEAYPAGAPPPSAFVKRRVLGALKVAIPRMAIATEAFEKVEEAKVLEMISAAGACYDQWKVEQKGAAQY